MGFKFKRVDLVGGSEEFPSGSGYASTRPKAETVLKKIAQALLDTNTGWALDSRTSTTTSFLDVPDNVSTPKTWPGLFFYNSTSGCKLFMCYVSTNSSSSSGIKNFSGNDLFKLNNAGDSNFSGLIMSIIPGESSNNFGNSFDSSFLPSDATRLYGTGIGTQNFASNSSSSYVYAYGVFANSFCVGICAERGSSGVTPTIGTPNYFVGKIFDQTLHSNDSEKYGIFRCKYISGSSVYENGYIINDTVSVWGTNVAYIGNDIGNYSDPYCCGSFAKSDGTWIYGTDSTYYCVKVIPDGYEQLAASVNGTSSGKSRWVPFLMAVMSSDLSTYCVVSGDGVKGYLDTDLFRCAIGTYGQQFDNGSFICIDGTYNFLIGWDPTNDPLVGT